jgi:hypothetical protein
MAYLRAACSGCTEPIAPAMATVHETENPGHVVTISDIATGVEIHRSEWRYQDVASHPPVPVEEFDGGAEEGPTYLGDGVNASFDGHYLRLRVDHGPGVCLNADTYRDLVEFAEANGFGGEG